MTAIESMRVAAAQVMRPLQTPGPKRSGPRVVRLEPMHSPLIARSIRKLIRIARGVYWRRRLAHFGTGAQIERPSWVYGDQSIIIGSGTHIWRFGRLEALNARQGETRIEIGEGSAIQPFAHIAAVESVRIGRGCLFASHVYITDHDHEFSDPMDPVILNDRVIASPVEIGEYVWLGEAVMVLKGVKIGERSVIGAGSVVTRDVPPFSIAIGSPARVVRRWNQTSKSWERVSEP